MKRSLAILLIGLAMLMAAPAARACELCKDSTAVACKNGVAPVTASFNGSIFWMLGGIGAVGGFAIRSVYRAMGKTD